MKFVNCAKFVEDPQVANSLRPTHRQYLARLLAEGKLAAAGPFADGSGGLFIYELESIDAAKAVAAADPFAAGGAFARYEVTPWQVELGDGMTTAEDRNKAFVLAAFDVLFNERDYDAAARYWSDQYIQHSAHIGPGRDGLFDLTRSLPATLRYENQIILADGDKVMLYGRFSGNGSPAAMISADVVRIQDGKLAEHWDVWQDEATHTQSLSGLPMFGDRFPGER